MTSERLSFAPASVTCRQRGGPEVGKDRLSPLGRGGYSLLKRRWICSSSHLGSVRVGTANRTPGPGWVQSSCSKKLSLPPLHCLRVPSRASGIPTCFPLHGSLGVAVLQEYPGCPADDLEAPGISVPKDQSVHRALDTARRFPIALLRFLLLFLNNHCVSDVFE